MIEMKVMGIALDTRTGSPIVVLHDKENRRALPIWIGSAEASSIIRKIENLSVTRPMTHDLIISIIDKTGYKITKVEINDVEKDTRRLRRASGRSSLRRGPVTLRSQLQTGRSALTDDPRNNRRNRSAARRVAGGSEKDSHESGTGDRTGCRTNGK